MRFLRVTLKRLVLATLVVATFSGCSDSTGPTIYGTYYLLTLNAVPLPITLEEFPGYREQFYAGTITLRSNGTFTDVWTFRVTESGTTTETDDTTEGTFVKTEDSEVILTYENGAVIVAELTGTSKLKMTAIEDIVFRYEK